MSRGDFKKFVYVKFCGGEGDEYGIGWVEGSVHGLLTHLLLKIQGNIYLFQENIGGYHRSPTSTYYIQIQQVHGLC